MASSGPYVREHPGGICLAVGYWKTEYDRFRRWADDGTHEPSLRHLQGEFDTEGRIEWSQFNVDSTIVQDAQTIAEGPNDDKKARTLRDEGIRTALGSESVGSVRRVLNQDPPAQTGKDSR